MHRKSNLLILFIFLGSIFTMGILNIITPDKSYSEMENRMLQKFPKISWNNIKSGRFSEQFERYISDQFVFKDFLVSIKSDIEKASLKGENNNIYFGEEQYLMEHYKKPGEEIDDIIRGINTFGEKNNISTSLMLIPNSVKIYEDKLPELASPYDQLKVIDYVRSQLNNDVDFIDVYNILSQHKEEEIYFRTDHHWTMRGAYYAYTEAAKKLGIEPYSLDEFVSEKVTDEFYGTYYSKANDRSVSADTIEIFKPKFDVEYSIRYELGNEEKDSLYEYSHLDKKDKYSVFLDGNHSMVRIKTSVNNGKKLLVIKDSYSHCFIPFLANHYEEVHILDLRYYKKDVYEYINNNDITQSLFIYNVGTFEDNFSVANLKKK